MPYQPRYRVRYIMPIWTVFDTTTDTSVDVREQTMDQEKAIRLAQRLNGFSPIDGKEETYNKQMREEEIKSGGKILPRRRHMG